MGKIEEGGGAIQWQSSRQTDSAYCILLTVLSAVADQPATPRHAARIAFPLFHFILERGPRWERSRPGTGRVVSCPRVKRCP